MSEITKEPNLLSILRQYNINEGSNNDFKNFRFKEKIFEKSNTRFNLLKEKIPVASQTFLKVTCNG